jgi:hypothetical protein
VAGAAVQAEVIDQIKGEKTISYHKRRRKHSSQRTRGHRQHLTLVRITEVLETGADASGVKAATGTADARRAAHEAPGAAKPRSRRPCGRSGRRETEARPQGADEGVTPHGTQEGRRFVPQRSRQRRSPSGREALWRPGAVPGNIICRQRGTTWFPGEGVGMGTDHTIFATVEGKVTFKKGLKGRTFISVLPVAEAAE